MKRILVGVILAGFSLLGQIEIVRALDEPTGQFVGCGGKPDEFIYNGVKGASISAHAEKISPANVIVIGQDQEKQIGVNLSVTIIAEKGTVIKSREVDGEPHPDNPIRSRAPDPAGYRCYTKPGGVKECYEKKCKEFSETVYRYINPDSISIWLDPSEETEQFLGWKQGEVGQYPLRYLFPEKWALGAWTPTGLEGETIGDWSPSGEEVWAFGQENSWFTFLFPDPNEKDLPGQHLLQMSQPQRITGSVSRRVLALYGPFDYIQSPYTQVNGTYARDCLIDASSLPGDANTPPSAGSCDKPDNYTYSDKENIIIINFDRIPLDLPGDWQIGIKAEQYPAKYDFGKTEVITDPNELKFGPSDYGWGPINMYDISTITFPCYVVISTPCTNSDPKSCKN
jgi:hypothetical protein